jgi:methylase of polypeptide subunit release factors
MALTGPDNDPVAEPLERLLRLLASRNYRFVTPTPASHARVVSRPNMAEARSSRDMLAIRDVLGWSLPFRPASLDVELLDCLVAANAVHPAGEALLRATIRVSSLDDLLFLHSAHPTEDADAVFFGPDSYRFATLIAAELERSPVPHGARIVDIGAGAGIGAIVAGRLSEAPDIVMVDVNPAAMRLARINANVAGVAAHFIVGDSLDTVSGGIDLAVANPPYLMDSPGRAYRDGGAKYGTEIAQSMAQQALAQLSPAGRLILYTGSAIIDGHDPLLTALEPLAARFDRRLRYREIDPDVFGEELAEPAYAGVDRIALIAAVVEPLD